MSFVLDFFLNEFLLLPLMQKPVDSYQKQSLAAADLQISNPQSLYAGVHLTTTENGRTTRQRVVYQLIASGTHYRDSAQCVTQTMKNKVKLLPQPNRWQFSAINEHLSHLQNFIESLP